VSDVLFDIDTSPYATARRGGIGLADTQAIADKLLEGHSVQAIALMLRRPIANVAEIAAALPRKTIDRYRPPRPLVTFSIGNMPPKKELHRIARDVATKHSLTVAELRGPSAKRKYALPRWEAFHLSRAAGYTLSQIGAFYGKRDHTTVLHGVRKHQDRIDAGEVK